MVARSIALAFLTGFSVLCHGFSVLNQEKQSEGLGMLNPKWTYIANYSFTVAVLVGTDLLGGGALIEQNWVLTAASVTRGFNASDLKIRVGSNSAYVDGRVHSITEVFVHPEFTKNSSYNLALLKIDTPIYPAVASRISYIARIPFMDNGIECNTTGYGSLSNSEGNGSPGVQIAQGYAYTSSYCNRHWGRPVSDVHMCAYSSYTVPCNGDEGDPLFRCWITDSGTHQCELLGIFTGIDECDIYEPYAFVDVGAFATWILNTINITSID